MESLSSSPWLRRALVTALLTGLFLLGFNVLRPFIVPAISRDAVGVRVSRRW